MSEKGKEVVVESSTHNHKAICVFAGTKLGSEGVYNDAAKELGQEIAVRKINLVYGGGIEGLNGSVALTAAMRGSHILGIKLQQPNDPNTFAYTIGTDRNVSNMHEQIWYMFQYASAFIALPGGLGTLEALFNVASWAKLNIHRKPLGLLNVNGFYDGLLIFLDHVVATGFMTQEARQLIISSSDVKLLLDQMISLAPELGLPMRPANQNPQDRGGRDEPDMPMGPANQNPQDRGGRDEPDTTLRL